MTDNVGALDTRWRLSRNGVFELSKFEEMTENERKTTHGRVFNVLWKGEVVLVSETLLTNAEASAFRTAELASEFRLKELQDDIDKTVKQLAYLHMEQKDRIERNNMLHPDEMKQLSGLLKMSKRLDRAEIGCEDFLPEHVKQMEAIYVRTLPYATLTPEQELEARERLQKSLHDLPEVTDSWIADAEQFQRRCTVENTLREAFQGGDLTLLHGPSTVVEWDRWANSTDFRVYYGLSMIRAPKHPYFATRRAPGLVKRVQFDEWIKRFGVDPEDEGNLTPGAQCINWLRNEVAKGPKQKTKDAYRIVAMAEIFGLTNREFDRCWANETPPNWKASGPLRR